jgi:hypothetical protein
MDTNSHQYRLAQSLRLHLLPAKEHREETTKVTFLDRGEVWWRSVVPKHRLEIRVRDAVSQEYRYMICQRHFDDFFCVSVA